MPEHTSKLFFCFQAQRLSVRLKAKEQGMKQVHALRNV
jgi:hypothetical protein